MMQDFLFSTLPVTCHTRHVGPGSTFVAIKGMKDDGVRYISQALALGAMAIVIDESVVLEDSLEEEILHKARLSRVKNTRYALAELSAAAHGYPANKLNIVGVTATKGKTTTVFLLEHILRTAGYATALLSTVKNRILDVDYPTELTTQQPDYLHAFLRACVDEGVTHVVMEVAAQALSLHRLATILFDAVLFLNFSKEHGEFYATLEDYFYAKSTIVNHLKRPGFLIIPQGEEKIGSMAKNFGLQQSVHYFSTHLENNAQDLSGIRFSFQDNFYECPGLIGDYNVLNARAAMICAELLRVPSVTRSHALQMFGGVPGRMKKYVLPNSAVAFIDYAHNPSSFEQVFTAMRQRTDHLIVVFGAGGERDAAKRPLMGFLAGIYADIVFLTTDNPRSEDPSVIIQEIMRGFAPEQRSKVYVEIDREKAIHEAYRLSRSGSIILLLGKGPDEYQLVEGIKTPFSEQEILKRLKCELVTSLQK